MLWHVGADTVAVRQSSFRNHAFAIDRKRHRPDWPAVSVAAIGVIVLVQHRQKCGRVFSLASGPALRVSEPCRGRKLQAGG